MEAKLSSATEARRKVWDECDQALEGLDKSLVGKWNDKCESEGWGDDYKVTDEYRFS